MSKRLNELQRQRALLQEHLAWLDQEIVKEQGSAPSGQSVPSTSDPLQNAATSDLPSHSGDTPPPLPRAKSPGSETGLKPSMSTPANAAADDIINRYRSDLAVLGQDTRKGCLLTAVTIGGLLILGAILAYALYAHHIGRWW